MRHRSITLILRVAVPLLLAGLLSGCMTTNAKVAAVKTVADLKGELVKHDEAQQKAIEGLIRQTMDQQRALLRERWALRKEELKVDLYHKSETRLLELRRELAGEINKALEPVEARLKKEIEAESGRGAGGAERVATLRLQLASTLAITQREVIKAEAAIEDKMRQARTTLLNELDEAFKNPPANIAAPVTDIELDAVTADLKQTLETYRTSIGETTDALSNYLTADAPWKLFLKGLAGDKLYKLILPKLNEVAGALQSKFEEAGGKILNKHLQRTQETVNSVKTK